MWKSQSTADAVYVRLQSSTFDYQGCFKPTAAGQLQLPSEVWSLANAATAGAGDPFKLELNILSGGVASGPIIEHLVIATGTLPGAVYYMTVGSKLTESGGLGTIGESAIVRLRPARNAELILGASGCTGCHGLSADGSRLVAYASASGVAYALSGASSANPPVVGPAPGAEYGALVPDGTLYLATAHPAGVGPRTYGASAAMNATLYETATGDPVADAGVPSGAMVAAFSGDASLVAFNDFAINGGRGLALMDFSESARAATAYRQVFSDPTLYPAWPSFLPDARALLFSLGQGSDFTGGGTGISGIITPGPATDVYVLESRESNIDASRPGDGVRDARRRQLEYDVPALRHGRAPPELQSHRVAGHLWRLRVAVLRLEARLRQRGATAPDLGSSDRRLPRGQLPARPQSPRLLSARPGDRHGELPARRHPRSMTRSQAGSSRRGCRDVAEET